MPAPVWAAAVDVVQVVLLGEVPGGKDRPALPDGGVGGERGDGAADVAGGLGGEEVRVAGAGVAPVVLGHTEAVEHGV